MKKILLVALILILAGVSAEVIPLNSYSELETGDTQKLTILGYPKYFDGETGLELIDSSIVSSNDEGWDFEVKKGIYQIRIKNDGELEFTNVGDSFTLKLQGVGFFNSETKSRVLEEELNLSNPTVQGNTISWSLPYNSTYSIVYENDHLKDILVLSQELKESLNTNKPEWNSEESLFGIIYDLDLSESDLIESKNFESEEDIKFLKDGKLMHSIRKAYATHEDWDSHWWTNNENKIWTKTKKYENGKYIEVIPLQALSSDEGSLRFNATISVDVNTSEDDADEKKGNVFTADTRLHVKSLYWGWGVRFQNITIPHGTTIIEATLTLRGGHSCGIGNARCETTLYGVDTSYSQPFGAGNKPSDQTKTTASVDFTRTDAFTPNGASMLYDLNVTDIVQEIVDRFMWDYGNPISFVDDIDYIGFGSQILLYSFDNNYGAPQLVIEFETPPRDVNVLQPTDGNYVTQYPGGIDTNTTIELNIMYSDSNHLLADINYNTAQSFGGTVIYHDLNLSNLDINGSERTDQLQCDSNDFSSPVFCSFDWNVSNVDNGNHYIIVNIKSSDSNESAFSGSFVIDNPEPITSSDINNFWQTFDANIHLTCTDVNGSGCNETFYRIDLDPTKDMNYGDWNSYDTNTNILISTDGNIGLQYYSTDLAGNKETTKEEFVLIDKTTHTLLTENYLPNPSNAAKNYLKMQDGNLFVSYCYKTGYHLGDAYYRKSADGLSWNSPVQINSDSGYCSGYYSENEIEPYRTGEGGITLTKNSLSDLFFLFTEWNGLKAWTKILYSNETWSDTTLIADNIGQSPNRDTINVVADSNDSINYIITQKSG